VPAGFYQGVRAVCLDRLPLVGQGFTAKTLQSCHFAGRPELEKLPVEEGLWVCGAFGSRGLTWGLACADHLASLMLGEPSVLEYSLSQALHPGRFIAERFRK
ncbi:MAG: bifunctional tRNA (5-methylaminomethyl-2-thiouridine)(34)-methyltransferase MnmD/FAD-dependent 5-carboxymethylaminomethyl-2-thiouridine(34) oxidoreductase MnmC, partial [Sutterella sp.]